ncbi:MAG TPA: LysR family transcriptional regulator [Sphingopyxis sp.]|nr:LysR family transcriptional regulator [Sphingopyxis sp.]
MVRLENLDLNLLRVFSVIYEERSISGAAKVLHVTQPAISNSLQRLRLNFQDPLFVRVGREMRPTSFADSFAVHINDALNSVKAGLILKTDFDPSTAKRTFRFSMNDPAEALFLKPLVDRLLKIAPNISHFCQFVSRRNLASEMALGTIDLAIDVPTSSDSRIMHRDLLCERYIGIVRKGHYLAGTVPSLDDYLKLKHIHVSARRRGLGHVERALAETNHRRTVSVRIRNPSIAADIIRTSDLSMTMPERVARYFNLETFELPFSVPPLNWRLYWPARLDEDPANRWLRDQILVPENSSMTSDN